MGSGSGRGLVTARVFRADGVLVATTAGRSHSSPWGLAEATLTNRSLAPKREMPCRFGIWPNGLSISLPPWLGSLHSVACSALSGLVCRVEGLVPTRTPLNGLVRRGRGRDRRPGRRGGVDDAESCWGWAPTRQRGRCCTATAPMVRRAGRSSPGSSRSTRPSSAGSARAGVGVALWARCSLCSRWNCASRGLRPGSDEHHSPRHGKHPAQVLDQHCRAWRHYRHRRLERLSQRVPRLVPPRTACDEDSDTRLTSCCQRCIVWPRCASGGCWACTSSVLPEHLQPYLDKFCFRLNRRRARARGVLLYRVMQYAAGAPPRTYRQLMASPRPKAPRSSGIQGPRSRPGTLALPSKDRPWRGLQTLN